MQSESVSLAPFLNSRAGGRSTTRRDLPLLQLQDEVAETEVVLAGTVRQSIFPSATTDGWGQRDGALVVWWMDAARQQL